MFSRRELIRIAGIAGASSLFQFPLSAQETVEQHLEIAQIIKRKFSGKNISVLYPKGCLANLKPIVQNFRSLTGVDVNLQEGSLDSISSELILKSRVQSKDSEVDLGLPATFGIPDLVEAEAIVDLDNYVKEYEPKDFGKGRFYSRGDFYQGKFYGYQTDGDTYILFLNKAWLESSKNQKSYQKQHTQELKVPGTWEELDQQICFFNDPKNGRSGGSLYRNKNYTIWEFWMRLHAKGIYPVSDNFVPQIAKKEGIEALEELSKITKKMEQPVFQNGLFDNFKSYAKGDKYCNLGWGGTQKYLNGPKSKMKDNLIFALPPGGKIRGSVVNVPYFNWGWNYVVSKKSKNPELAYLFSLFVSTSKMSVLSVREADGYFDPFMKNHYQDKQIQRTYSKSFLKVHQEALQNSIPDFYVKGQGLYYAALKEGIDVVLKGYLTAAQALENVSKKWEKITDSIGRQNQAKQWKFLKKSYPESVQKLLQ